MNRKGKNKSKTITIPVPKTKNKTKRRVATKNDWQTKEMPSKIASFIYVKKFKKKEIEYLKRGNIPKAMENKWFFYYETINYIHT